MILLDIIAICQLYPSKYENRERKALNIAIDF